ncbi:MAG TPA: DUF4122 family protein [Dysgonomonas sp.]|uniref:DUF4122 family protein n=1 Tax=unclassified Dysgonomonas TaxID=2630389 RepID=UPI0025BBE811|nr:MULTISPECIES: DUF4122 family protein [unclassified Dysgonomonas]HML65230.1 DUF4122 family protein [Dysgonomonas sp.]
MKALFICIVIILQALKVFLIALKKLLFLFHEAISRSLNCTGRVLRILYIKAYRLDKNKKKEKAGKLQTAPIPRMAIQHEGKENIVGLTKTEFITELPKLRSQKPFLSVALETEPVYVEEEEDILPDDIDMDTAEDIRKMLEEEDPEMFSHENDMVSEEVSTGVSFEKLTETFNVLSADMINPEQEKAAADVLLTIEGTGFMSIFMLQAQCAAKAKKLMDSIGEGQELHIPKKQEGFDMSKYI